MAYDLAFVLFAYLVGSISSAVIVCKIMGVADPRQHGSNNPGATNVLRLYGKRAAIITLAGDLLKGLIPLLIGQSLGVSHLALAGMALAAFLGHLYPVFFRFQGGKGVATFIGVLYGLAWPLGVIFMLEWSLIAWITRYSSLSALIAAAASIYWTGTFTPSHDYTVAVTIMVALMFWRHRPNIRKLLAGTESRLGGKKRN